MHRIKYFLGWITCLCLPFLAKGSDTPFNRASKSIWNSPILTEDIYVQLNRHWSKRPFTKLLLNIVFIPEKITIPADATTNWQPYQGYTIGAIHTQQLGTFEPLLHDASITQAWKKVGAILFPPTRSWVIQSKLNFETGDRLAVAQLEGSLDHLKALAYIKQAQISLVPQDKDTVDILVETQDEFPLQAGLNLEKKQLAITHHNVAGLGHRWTHYLSHDERFGYGFTYQALIPFFPIVLPELTGELNYSNTRKKQIKRIAIFQDFIQQSAYAGCAEVSNQGYLKPRFLDNQNTAINTSYQFYYHNLWLGKAWQTQAFDQTGRLYATARLYNQNFQKRPAVGPTHNRIFHHHIFALGSIGFAHTDNQGEHFVYDVGCKENIPTGFKYNFISGYQMGEFWNRPYIGLDLAHAGLMRPIGYIASSINLGSFLRHATFEQSIFKLSTHYFTPLLPSKNYTMRYFIQGEYLVGFNMFTAERLSTHTKRVVKEWADPFPPGTQRFKLHLESVCWPRRLIAGCQLAIVGFIDAVTLHDDKGKTQQNTFCEKLGMGLRVGHERFAFGTIQANISYHPIVKATEIEITIPINLSSEALTMREPKTIDYRYY